MRGLEELPDRDKDGLLPYMLLRPWTTAHYLDSAMSRLEEAYGDRPTILDIDSDIVVSGARRPVHDEIDALKNPSDGYEAWVRFIAARENIIPALQIGVLAEVPNQVQRFANLARGLVVRLEEEAFGIAEGLARLIAVSVPGPDICFVLDYCRETNELLTRVATASRLVERLQAAAPGCVIALSASSFPDSLVGRVDQDIYERQFFDGVALTVGGDNLIYSDRGSARVERQTGGGGTPPPRIDYAARTRWTFFREEGEGDARLAAYRRAARRAIGASGWDPALRLWGTQMIERTAGTDPDAIVSPMRATAVRINIHLHQQLFYDDGGALHDTDEEWSD
jgi:hypothetical protein